MSSIEILKAKRAGFCFGVKRAVNIAFKAAKKNKNVFTLGPLIHNPQVIQRLSLEGVFPIEDIENNKNIETLIIRTHGIPLALQNELSKKDFKIIDATCPFVKKAQQYAKLLRDNGYQVIILGDKEHPEVKSLMGYAGTDAIVFNSDYNVKDLKSKKKVGVVVQTTQPISLLSFFIRDIMNYVKELKVFNTICNSTALRLKETQDIAGKVDLMIIAGGKNSANTTQLAKLCIATSVKTYHIEIASELKEEWLKGVERVGISAGASTPDWIINDIEERIRYIGGKGDNGYPHKGGRN